MLSKRALLATIVLSTAIAHADDEHAPDASVPEAPAVPLAEPVRVARVALPHIESRAIERVTYAIEGEEGEHAEVTVTRDGAVRVGRARRGMRGGLPVLRPRVRRVRNPTAFFDGLARLCAESSFVDAPADRRERFGMWNTLTVAWAGHSRTIVVGSAGLTRELVMHVVNATAISNGIGIP